MTNRTLKNPFNRPFAAETSIRQDVEGLFAEDSITGRYYAGYLEAAKVYANDLLTDAAIMNNAMFEAAIKEGRNFFRRLTSIRTPRGYSAILNDYVEAAVRDSLAEREDRVMDASLEEGRRRFEARRRKLEAGVAGMDGSVRETA